MYLVGMINDLSLCHGSGEEISEAIGAGEEQIAVIVAIVKRVKIVGDIARYRKHLNVDYIAVAEHSVVILFIRILARSHHHASHNSVDGIM